jgi:hypothetical protein
MSLDHEELLRLSRIADALRRTDPELARELSGPLVPRRVPWPILAGVTLAVCGLLAVVGIAIGDVAVFAAGGLALLTVYPVLLLRAGEQRPRHGRHP